MVSHGPESDRLEQHRLPETDQARTNTLRAAVLFNTACLAGLLSSGLSWPLGLPVS